MTISNKIPAALCAGFLMAALALGLPLQVIGTHGLTALACLLVTFGCFAAGWMGGGDAKLIAATALWFGPSVDLMQYILLGSVYGGALTLALLAARALVAPATGIGFVDHLLHPKTGIPYGIALGFAGLTVYGDSPWIDLALGGR